MSLYQTSSDKFMLCYPNNRLFINHNLIAWYRFCNYYIYTCGFAINMTGYLVSLLVKKVHKSFSFSICTP